MKSHLYLCCCIWLFLAFFISCSKGEDSPQEALPPITISNEMSTISSSWESESKTITFVATTPWVVEVSYDWLHISPTSGEVGNISLALEIKANTTTKDRSGIIDIKAGGKIYKINIKQQAAPATFSVSPKDSIVTSEAGTIDITIISNSSWNTNTTADWVNLSTESGKGNQTITASYLANDGPDSRNAIINFTSGDQSQTLTLTQKGKTPDPVLSIDKTSVDIEADSGSFTMNVSSNSDWNTSGVPEWITLSPAQGNGNKSVVVGYQSNESYIARSAVVTFTGSGKSQRLTISQQGKSFEPTLSIDKISINAEAIDGVFMLNVSSNSDWSTSGVPTWVTLSPAQGNGDKMVTVNYQANSSTDSRTTVITFTAGKQSQTLTLTQKGKTPDPILSIDKTSANIEADSGSFTMNISSNSDWSTSGIPTWVTLSPAQGNGDKMVMVNYQANSSTDSRTTVITFTAGKQSQTLTLTQKGKTPDPILSIDKTSVDIEATSGSFTMNVSSNSDWSTSGVPAWITLSPVQGNGNKSVVVGYQSNESYIARSATITFTGSGKSQRLTISQQGKSIEPTISIDKTSVEVEALAGEFILNVSSNSDWSVSGIPQSWVTLSSTQGNGNKMVTVNYRVNDYTDTRSAVITFTAGKQSQTLTLTQKGKTLSLDKTSVNVEAASGSFAMNIISNIDWTTSGIPTWVTLSPAQGQGNKMVTVSYQANSSTSSRQAVIAFWANKLYQTLTLTQQGKEADKIELSRNLINASALSANTSLSVTANTAWSVSNVPSWLTVSPNNGTQNGTVTIGWETNTNSAERSATLRFTAGTSQKDVVVTQAGQYILTVETTALQFKSTESSQVITFYANDAWHISYNQEWLSLSTSTGYDGNQNVTVYAKRNPENTVRNGVITITMGTGPNQISKQIKVTQAAQPIQPTLTVSSTQLKAPFQASSYNVTLTSNMAWSGVSDKAWCTISPASGNGNASIKLSVERNSVNQSRVAVVTLKAGSEATGYVSTTITVTQNANNDFSITDWGNNGDHGGTAQ